MDFQEYELRKKEILTQLQELNKEYAISKNQYKIDDIVSDHTGRTIKVATSSYPSLSS